MITQPVKTAAQLRAEAAEFEQQRLEAQLESQKKQEHLEAQIAKAEEAEAKIQADKDLKAKLAAQSVAFKKCKKIALEIGKRSEELERLRSELIELIPQTNSQRNTRGGFGGEVKCSAASLCCQILDGGIADDGLSVWLKAQRN